MVQEPKARVGNLSDEDIALLSSPGIFENGRLSVGRGYTPLECAAHGYKGVVWRVEDVYGKQYAAKITLAEDYEGKSVFGELSYRGGLPSPLFTNWSDVGEWKPAEVERAFVVTVEEWVDGITLFELCEKRGSRLTVNSIVSYAGQIANVLEALQVAELAHDDLHWKNVMLRDALPGEPSYGDPSGVPLQVVVVDTGSLKKTIAADKPMTDLHHVARHLSALHNIVARRRDLSIADRRFLRALLPIIQMLGDDDGTKGIAQGQGAALRDAINDALVASQRGSDDPLVLSSPFEFITAEQIGNDALLLKLFARTSWVDEVSGTEPILLTGPRGCGKSMVFRWLALRAHATEPELSGDLARISGVYVSCTSDMQTRFSHFRSAEDVAGHEREIEHYFNLLHVLELLNTLAAMASRHDAETFFGLALAQQQQIHQLIRKHLPAVDTYRFSPSPLRSAIELVEHELFASQRRLHAGVNDPPCPPTLLADVTDPLTRIVPYFKDRKIAFLLDDFSTHRISEAVQEVLSPLIWERRASHLFKVSSEKYGSVHTWRGLTGDPGRERVEVDCGIEYLKPTAPKANREFARKLLENRLKAAEWSGTPDQLIGASPSSAEFTAALLKKRRSDPAYYGLDTIAELCSGDISTLLLLYRKILAGSTKTSHMTIKPAVQHRAVIEVSRQLLSAVAYHRPLGKRLHSVALAFGNFVGNVYREGKGTKDHDAIVPIQVPRIEVDGADATLAEDEVRLSQELVRRAVFIEMDIGRSRHANVSTLRWHFRRIYLPAFRAGLSKNDAVKIQPGAFQWFLQDPKEMLEAQFKQRKAGPDSGLRTLFEEDE